MRFMIIVKASQESEAGAIPKQELIDVMVNFHEEMQKAGVLVDGSGLKPSSQGFRVKYSGTKRTVVDGPFAETKELIAGYTIINVKSRDEAVAWAKRFPNPRGEGLDTEIEVRPFLDLDDFGPSKAVDRF